MTTEQKKVIRKVKKLLDQCKIDEAIELLQDFPKDGQASTQDDEPDTGSNPPGGHPPGGPGHP